MRRWLRILFFLLAPAYLSGGPPAKHHKKTGKSPLPQISFKGTDESQRWQNHMADIECLVRIKDHDQLLEFEKTGILVSLPETETIWVDPRLKTNLEYCYALPRVIEFLNDYARALRATFPSGYIQVNSAVRDTVWERNLQKNNPNAAAASGPKASSHLTGATIDIAKLKMPRKQIVWMRKKLFELAKKRMIWVTEENNQAVFHIMVFSTYKKETAEVRK